jgi:hypothetical protein
MRKDKSVDDTAKDNKPDTPCELEKCLARFEDMVFACRFQEADKLFAELVELLTQLAAGFGEKEMKEFAVPLSKLLAAREKKDYLLLADTAEYDLLPFLQKLARKEAKA